MRQPRPKTPWHKLKNLYSYHWISPEDHTYRPLSFPTTSPSDNPPPPASPEVDLLTAVLIDGIHSALSGNVADREWLLDWSVEPIAYRWICYNLSIDADELILKIAKEWKKIKLKSLSPTTAAKDHHAEIQIASGGHPKNNPKPRSWSRLDRRIKLLQKNSSAHPKTQKNPGHSQ